MTLMNTLTDVIANPKRVRASQERASERLYTGLERKMGAISDVSPEPAPSSPSAPDSSASSRAPSQERRSRLPLRRPELHRSHSEIPKAETRPDAQPEFPPCITATELTSEQMKKTYSHDDLQKWDKARYPLPPICAMQGNFRYRTATNADPQWRTEHIKKQLHNMDGLCGMLADLDMEYMTGLPNEEWQSMTVRPRRESAISSQSGRTNSTGSLLDAGADRQNGPRVYRGFSPSRSTSTLTSSFHSRKGSTLSVMNLPSEADTSTVPSTRQRQPTLSPTDRRASATLSTISELQAITSEPGGKTKKVAKPCDFSDGGDPESAVASDAEDDDEAWSDVVDSELYKVSAITQMLKEGKKQEITGGLTRVRTTSSESKQGRGSSIALDRARTIRASKGTAEGRKSKIKSSGETRPRSNEKVESPAILNLTASDSGEDESQLTMRIKKAPKDLGSPESRPIEAITTDDNTLVAENQLEFLPRAPRKRSTTALFGRGGTKPVAAAGVRGTT